MEAWKMTLHFEGSTFSHLKSIAANILAEVVKAKTYKELPIAGGGGYSMDGNDYRYSVEYSCPVEQRIANLRAEADELESGLGSHV